MHTELLVAMFPGTYLITKYLATLLLKVERVH